MNPSELRQAIIDSLTPSYFSKFNVEPSKNAYNISSLTHGSKAYLYNRRREKEKMGYNRHILRGAAIDQYIKERMEKDFESGDGMLLKWILPYSWKDKSIKDIILLGHFDLRKRLGDNLVFEVKAPESFENFNKNGSMTRAKRQLGAYAHLLSVKEGKQFQAFVVTINHDIIVTEISQEEIMDGWHFVRKTAYEVAKELDQ